MSDFDDEDIRDDVNNALDDDQIDDRAEDDQDEIDDDQVLDNEDDDSEDDDSDDSDDDSGKKRDRSAPVDDKDSEDEDDDPAIDYARPDFTPGGSAQVQPFDVRTLPRDENGLIDPEVLNNAIREHYEKQGTTAAEQAKRTQETKDLLTQQWTRVSKKYPQVYGNAKLRDLARDMHLNSIGTANYLTPAQAAAKIERTRRELVKTGYKSAKTRRTVENMTRTERGGSQGSKTKMSEYDKAKTLARSRDPAKAKQGRLQILHIRRQARKSR